MSDVRLIRVPAKTAAEVTRRYPLEEPAKPLLTPEAAPKAFLDALVEKNLLLDAIRFLAYALPKREAVWWACQCIKLANAVGKAGVALKAAERWATAPSEPNRRAAQKESEAATPATPAGCAALAAFVSDGSLAPPNVPAVPPADDLTAKAVVGAVSLAAVQAEPEKATEKQKQFVALGVEVAMGRNRWPER